MSLQHFQGNPDYSNPAYNTEYGIYSEGCGLNNVLMSWGHDDYMYLVCILSKPPNSPYTTFLLNLPHIMFSKSSNGPFLRTVSRWPRGITLLFLQLVFSSSDTIHFTVLCELSLTTMLLKNLVDCFNL